MATTTTTATPEYTPEHPPAYTRADDTPAYELDDVSRTSLHPSQIEACAPKPPPRQFKIFRYKPSKRVAIWVGVGLVCVCALVGTMIWYGVDRKRREASPARLGLAETIVRPQVPSSPDSSTDGSLVTPLSFSSPNATIQSLKFDDQPAGNYTIYKSSTQTLRLPATDFTFVKLFGQSSCGVVFKVGTNQSETDIVVGVDAQWRQRVGDDDATSRAWGMAEANAVQGGMYLSEGNKSAGLMLLTSPTTWKRTGSRPTLWQGTVDDVYTWDQAVVYKILVVYPPSFTPSDSNRALKMWAQPRTDVLFDNHGNLTFASIDVRLPQGSVISYGYEANDKEHYNGVRSDALSISVGRGMSGQYSAGTNVTLLALDGPPTDSWTNAQIQTDLTFHEPRTAPSGSLSTPITARLVAPGYVTFNITSLPPLSMIDLQAVSTNRTVQGWFLTPSDVAQWGNKVAYRLAHNEKDRAIAWTQVAKRVFNSNGFLTTQYELPITRTGRKTEGSADWTAGVPGASAEDRRTSRIEMDARHGPMALSLGDGGNTFYF